MDATTSLRAQLAAAEAKLRAIVGILGTLERLATSATKGPWYASEEAYGAGRLWPESVEQYEAVQCTVSTSPNGTGWCIDGGHSGYGISKRDAELIAALRNSLPDLIEAARGMWARYDNPANFEYGAAQADSSPATHLVVTSRCPHCGQVTSSREEP